MTGHHHTDVLFEALADPSRRKLLDLLHAHDGRTLNELCKHLDMTRQGVTQHLNLLEAANLVATVRRGREKLHFLNPSTAPGDLRALDCQVRKAAPQGALRSETTPGESQWLDRPSST
jgi:DNA-binding transcriptional ArsR family regulator